MRCRATSTQRSANSLQKESKHCHLKKGFGVGNTLWEDSEHGKVCSRNASARMGSDRCRLMMEHAKHCSHKVDTTTDICSRNASAKMGIVAQHPRSDL